MTVPWQDHPTFVGFDVFDDVRRDRLREVLRLRNDWLQRSLWLLPGTSRHAFAALADEIDAIVAGPDRVFCHRPCRACLARVLTPSMLVSPPLRRWADERLAP